MNAPMHCQIALAESDQQIQACFPVMAELRPHLQADAFVPRVRRQEQQAGYRLLYLEAEGAVKAAAGFRIGEYLAWGKALYVDDLITSEADRSRGFGGLLFERLVAIAREHGCDELHLDSGVQRFAAHRFYLNQRMDITSHHFRLKLR